MPTATRKPTPAARPTTAKPASGPAKATISKATPAKSNGTSVAQRQSTAVMRGEDVPDYIKKDGGGRGNEAVGMADQVIPRLEIVQALSPCKKKGDAAYIEGAEDGDIFNTVTRAVFKADEGVTIVPVLFKKEYLVWKDRKKGGGFRGSYPNLLEANARISGEPDADDLAAAETAQQLVLVVNEDGSSDEAVISMARTKLKVSKQFNSLIKLGGGDRFSRSYRLFTADETNNDGQDYKNFAVALMGFPDKETYEKAEGLYTALMSGARNMVVDTSDEGEPEQGKGGEY